MLALTRRVNEEIVIGDPANPLGVIRVVSVHGDKVRLSFDFPREIKINRRELAELKKKMSLEGVEFVPDGAKASAGDDAGKTDKSESQSPAPKPNGSDQV